MQKTNLLTLFLISSAAVLVGATPPYLMHPEQAMTPMSSAIPDCPEILHRYHFEYQKCRVFESKWSVKEVDEATSLNACRVWAMINYCPDYLISYFATKGNARWVDELLQETNLDGTNIIDKLDNIDAESSQNADPFMDLKSMMADAAEDYKEFRPILEQTIRASNIQVVFDRIESRVKELDSLERKFFDRVAASAGGEFIYDFNINDIVAFRFQVLTEQDAGKMADYLKRPDISEKLGITNVRSRDGTAYFGSGTLPNTISVIGKPALYEIQIWPFALGEWMRWQHGVYYKNPSNKKNNAIKQYVKSLEAAARCLSLKDFIENILPGITDENELKLWLETQCLDFIVNKAQGKFVKINEINLDLPEELAENPPTLLEDIIQIFGKN